MFATFFKFCKICKISVKFSYFCGILRNFQFFSEFFCEILKFQLAHFVDLEKCCKMSIWLQKSALIQPRTSRLKFADTNIPSPWVIRIALGRSDQPFARNCRAGHQEHGPSFDQSHLQYPRGLEVSYCCSVLRKGVIAR